MLSTNKWVDNVVFIIFAFLLHYILLRKQNVQNCCRQCCRVEIQRFIDAFRSRIAVRAADTVMTKWYPKLRTLACNSSILRVSISFLWAPIRKQALPPFAIPSLTFPAAQRFARFAISHSVHRYIIRRMHMCPLFVHTDRKCTSNPLGQCDPGLLEYICARSSPHRKQHYTGQLSPFAKHVYGQTGVRQIKYFFLTAPNRTNNNTKASRNNARVSCSWRDQNNRTAPAIRIASTIDCFAFSRQLPNGNEI